DQESRGWRPISSNGFGTWKSKRHSRHSFNRWSVPWLAKPPVRTLPKARRSKQAGVIRLVVIVASARETAARALAQRWEHADAHVLTPLDLSLKGWRCRFCTPTPGMAVVDGKVIPVEVIRGVVTRLPWITEDEIPHVALQDRAYVAAEMH